MDTQATTHASIGTTTTAVLLDSHPVWLNAIEQVLRQIGIRVVAKCTNTTSAADALERLDPDLILLDQSCHGSLAALDVLKAARVRNPSLKAIVVSASAAEQQIAAAFAAGAQAYVVKSADPADIALAVRQAFAVSVYLAHDLRLAHPAAGAQTAGAGLTRREAEILSLVAEGLANGQIAKKLWVTEQTVKFHLANVYKKLAVKNRTEASRWAHLQGIVGTAPGVPQMA